jgi:hypothetical protein
LDFENLVVCGGGDPLNLALLIVFPFWPKC